MRGQQPGRVEKPRQPRRGQRVKPVARGNPEHRPRQPRRRDGGESDRAGAAGFMDARRRQSQRRVVGPAQWPSRLRRRSSTSSAIWLSVSISFSIFLTACITVV